MGRYFSRPRGDGYIPPGSAEDTWYTDPLVPSLDAPEHEARFTGLFDASGNEIWIGPNPMGFGKDREWK